MWEWGASGPNAYQGIHWHVGGGPWRNPRLGRLLIAGVLTANAKAVQVFHMVD